MATETILNYCDCCGQKTKHSVLFTKVYYPESYDAYHCCDYFKVVECNGCSFVSFRQETHDFEDRYQDEFGIEEYDIKVTNYPQTLKKHRTSTKVYLLPLKIKIVYLDTIAALKAKCYLLAGVGFRAVIEAICIEEKIKGRNLEDKIDALTKNRLITEKEGERLHSIRFLGNDSIHQMEVPNETKLYLVLDIVDHLLHNLYLMDIEAKSILETRIKFYEDFEALFWNRITNFLIGEENTIRAILGKNIRRVTENLKTFETNLISRIKTGEIDYVELGEIKVISQNTTEKFQHYKRVK